MIYPNVNQIIHGDHLDVMKNWRNDCIDLTITSPPYDNARNYDGYKFNVKKTLLELFRVTKLGGIVVWVTADKMHNNGHTLTSFKHALIAQNIGFNVQPFIWQKPRMIHGLSQYSYFRNFEYMLIMTVGTHPSTFNPLRDQRNATKRAKTTRTVRNKDGDIITTQAKNIKNPNMHYTKDGKFEYKEYGRRGSIWYYPTGHNSSTKDEYAFKHPAIFPEQLARDHILSWSQPHDTILDPMCGSGTVCKMAKIHNRNYIGIDISDEYCNLSRTRVNFYTLEE